MITLTEDYELERDQYCWHLHHWRDGINPKTKKPTRTRKTTYHANLLQVCETIIDREAGEQETIKEMRDLIVTMVEHLASRIEAADISQADMQRKAGNENDQIV